MKKNSVRLLWLLLAVVMVSSLLTVGIFAEDTGTPEAEVNSTEVASYDEFAAALAEGGKIKLTADITVDTKITAIDGTTIDLNGNTLYVNVENSYYNNVTIENGNIVLGKDDVHVCDGYFLVNEGKTLALNGVIVSSAEGGIKGYAVFHLKTGANLDLVNSNLTIHGNEYAAGYLVYAGESTATVDIEGSIVTGSEVNGIVHATTAIKTSYFAITDATEHGINRSGVTITNSDVKISGGTGRGITAQHGPLVIDGNSTVTIEKMGEATIELRNNQDLTIAETATVKLDAAVNNTTSGTITGTVILPPKGTVTHAYTGTTSIWGEATGNARDSFAIKLYSGDTLLVTATLNDPNGVIIDGNIENITWNIPLNSAGNDSWWNVEWVQYITVDLQPTKVVAVVDSVEVATNTFVLNAPDDLNQIYAATADADGKILAFYTNVQEAIKAAAPAGNVEILRDVTVDKWIMFAEKMNIGNGKLITLNINGMTINGNDHTLTINSIESAGNGGYLFYDAENLTVNDLTIQVADGLVGGIGLQSGTISNVTFNGGQYGVLPGANGVTITGCTFNGTNGHAIYYEGARPGIVVTDNTFNTAEGKYAITMRGNEQFTDNTIINGRVNLANSASSTVTGNNFGTERFKVYNGATATISGNTINNLVFNEPTAFAGSTFANNTLSDDAQAAIDALPVLAGTGTAADPYIIKDIDGLKWFRDQVNAGNTFAGKTVKLADDINLNNEEWTPIGNSTNQFQGIFDGQEHTISNLLITGTKSNVGLFGYTTNGEIKNLTVKNAKVSGRLNVGVVAGTPYTTKYTNIKVTGHVEVNGMAYVGGVGGKNAYANWTDITVDVDDTSYVKAVSTEDGIAYRTYVGGVIGFIGEGGHTFTDISSNIDVIGDVCDIGGLFGIAHYGNNFVNVSCSADVKCTGEADEIGGIAGVWNNTKGYTVTFSNAQFTGTVTDVNGEVENVDIVGGAYNADDETPETSGSLKIDGVEAWLCVATINGVKYPSLQAAIDAAAADQTVTLLADVTLTETLTIPADKTVVLNLNGKTISQEKACTASYSMIENKGSLTIKDEAGNGKISFKDTGAGDPAAGWGSYTIHNSGTLVVENGTIEHLGEQNQAGKAFAHTTLAIFQYTGSTTINGGTISTPNYRSLRLWSGDVTINGGTFDGQVWVHCVNDTAKMTINGGNFSPNGNDGSSVFVNNSGYKAEFAVTGGTFETKIGANDVDALAGAITGGSFTEAAKNGTNAALIDKDMKFGDAVDGFYGIVEKNYVAEINGEKYESLAEALDAAQPDATIKLLANVTLTETLTIPAGKTVVLDLNGKTVSMVYANDVAANHEMIKNKGALTIQDTVGGGKLSYEYTGANLGTTYAANTLTAEPGSTLTVKGGTIENLTYDSAIIAYAIDGRTNGGSGDVTVTIEGGVVTSRRQAVRIFANSTTNTGTLNISGGEITGRVIVQNANAKANKAALSITGGTFNANEYKTEVLYVGGSTGATIDMQPSVSGGVFKGEIISTMNVAFITGGSFTEAAKNGTNAALIDKDVKFGDTVDANGYYVIVEKNYVAEIKGGEKYESLAEALDAAQPGDTIKLLADVTLDAPIVIVESITIDGNGKTITYTGSDRAIDVPKTANGANVTIKNLTLAFTGGYSQRGINYNTNGKLILDKVTVNGTNVTYAVNMPSSSANAEVEINNSSITGLIALNVWGANAKVDVTNTALTSVDKATHENYAAVKLNNNGTDAAEGAVITITGGSITAKDENGDPSAATTNATATGVINISDTTTVTGNSYEYVAAVLYNGYNEFYGFASLQDAIEKAENDPTATVKLLKDITISEKLVIEGNVVIDGNGKTITYTGSDRAIDVPKTANGANVTIKNLTLAFTGGYSQRGINYNTNGKLILDNVTVNGTNVTYAVNLPSSSANAEVEINNSSITGLIALNVWGANAKVVATNSHFTSVDKNSAENYAAVKLNSNGTDSAEGATITITGGSITARDENGNLSSATTNATATGVITISDTTVVIGNHQKTVAAVLYSGANEFYGCFTLQEAIDKAANDPKATVKLLRNITISEKLVIEGNVVIDGNGKTITYTGSDRIMDVAAANVKLTLKDINLVSSASYCQRGINIGSNVELTLNNVSVKGTNVTYALNLAGASDNANVTIIDSDLTGCIALNVWGKNVVVNATNSEFVSVDTATHENYAAIALNNNGTYSAENAVITITGGKITALDENGAPSIAIRNASATGVVNVSDATVVTGEIREVVAIVTYNGYDEFYSHFTLQDAINKAANDPTATVKLLKDIELSDILVINGAVTIDGNGHKITSTAGRAINIDTTEAVTIKNLTIVGSTGCERGINIINQAGTTNLSNVKISGVSHYAVHVATSAGAAKVNIAGSELSGYAALAVYGEGSEVEVSDSALSSVNEYADNGSNSFATIVIAANNAEISVEGGSVSATAEAGKAPQAVVGMNAGRTNMTLYLDTELVKNGTATLLDIDPAAVNVTLRAEYADEANAEGYAVIAVDGMITVKAAVACIGDTYYATIADAIKDAQPGDTVTLLANVTLDTPIKITKSLTIDGGDYTLTYTGTDRAIDVPDTANGANVTIKNLTVVAEDAERVLNYNTNGTFTVENVIATGGSYAINFPSSADNAKVSIKDSKLTALIALNIWGSNMEIIVTDSELYSVDDSTQFSYAAIQLNNDMSVNVADGTTVTVNGGKLSAVDENNEPNIAVANWSATGKVNISSSTVVVGDVKNAVAFCAGVGFYTLQDAIDGYVKYNYNAPIVLVRDIELTEGVTVPAGAKITIDLNGKTVTSATSTIVVNGGELTVKDETGEGKVVTTGTGDEAIALKNNGKVILNGGNIEGVGYAIYVYSSGGTLVMNGGTVSADWAITVGTGTATITNGTVNGKVYAFADYNGSMSITGGSFDVRPDTQYIAYKYGAVKTGDRYEVKEIDPVAYIGTTGYYTLEAALKAAKDYDTIDVRCDWIEDNNLSITKDITLNTNGYTVLVNGSLSISADGVTVNGLNVVSNGTALYINAKDVLIDNCQITGSNGLYQSYTKGTVTFKNSTITGSTYGIHFDGSAGGNIVIDNCVITGWTSFAASIEKVTISGSTFKDGNYNVLRFYQDAEVTNTTFPAGMRIDSGDEGAGMSDITLSFNDCSVADGSDFESVFPDSVIVASEVIVNGKPLVRAAKIGNTYYETLADALAAAKDQKDIVIDLLADATLDITAWQTLAIGGDTTETITINGNGNTLTFNKLNSDWDHIATNNDAKLILNDMTITDSGYNNGPWNRYDINFACDVELNDVTATKALAFKADASLNDVTVNETGDNYAIWIQANGQNVTIDGLTVTSAGRGIKISEEYVNAPAKVELAVSNATFTTAKKAAVLVGSKAGATITEYNVDITNVKQDSVNIAWVDEDWAAHYGEVTVNGGTLAQESVEIFTAALTKNGKVVGYYETLDEAINAAENGDTVTLLAPIVVKAGETLILNKAITITYTSNVPGEDMITNKGNLIIDGTTLVYVNTDTTASNVTVSTISCEPGSTLTVTSGVVKNDSANNGAKGIYAFAIDLLTNGSLGDVTATINGGEIICTNYMAIRQFNNGEACKNTLNVNGGYIYGARRAIQIHLKNNAAYTTITGGTIEAGDYSLCFLTTSENITVSGGKFIGSVWYSGTDGFISGGNFSEPVAAAYCAEGYVPTENADGTYGVREITPVTVILDDVTVVMGNKLPEFTYQLSDPALADKITVTFDAINYTAAGTYTITATVAAPESYEVTVVNGTLTVQTAVVSVKADGITTYYASFDEAWEAAPASKGGVNFILLASVTLDRTYVYNDTNGGYVEFAAFNNKWNLYTITGTTSDPLFKIESGTPKFKNLQISAYGDAFYVTGGSLNIMGVGNDGQNTIVTSQTGNVVYTRGGSTTILGGPTLTAYGEYPAIQGNGMYAGNVTIQRWSWDIPSKISAPNTDIAIYWPQNGTLNISFGEITGKTAVWAKSGNIIISGGTFIATGDKVAYAPYNNGAHATGDALVIEASANAAYELPVVSITGGTFRSANGEAVAYYTEGESKLADELFISGGIFSSDVSAICEYGYGAEPQNDGTYVVKPMIVINIEDKNMVAGNALPEFTYTVESFNWNVTTTLQTLGTDTDGKSVGIFTINGTPVAVEGYYVKVVPATLTVTECIVTVDGIAYDNWNDAKPAIKRNSVIKLYADIEYGIDENGKKVEHKFPANGGNIVLDLNGHNLTYHYAATIQFKTVLTVTDTSNGTPGKLIADYAANPFVISPESSLELTNGVIFEGNLQLNGSTSKAGYLSINGQKVIGNALSNSPVQFINGYVRIKITDNFSNIQVTNGTLQIAENCKTPANQTVILNAGTSLIVPEGVTLNLDATTDLVINGTLNVEGTLVVNSFEHFKQFLNMESVKNLAVGSTIVIDEDYVLDLAGRTILVDGLSGVPAFRVLANVTVKNGTVDATAGVTSYAFIVGNSTTAGTLTVENGNYYGRVTAISVTLGDLIIKDGYFKATEYNGAHEFTINCIDANYKNGTATVTITGGTFYGFNPQNNAAEGKGTNYLTADYATVNENGAYTVVRGVAAIGNVGYLTLQDAIAAAKDGDTIILLSNLTLGKDDVTLLAGKYNTIFLVEGKDITIDLNGKTISADAAGLDSMLVGVFSTDNGGHLTLNDTVGGAVVEAASNGATVYGLIVNYESGCSITINGGTYKLDKASDSLVYSGCNVVETEDHVATNGIVVNGGTFILDNVGSGTNGMPWIFNTSGKGENHVAVNGGSFNFDVNHQYWIHEVQLPGDKALVKDETTGMWTVYDDAEVHIVEMHNGYGHLVGYRTFAEAIKSIVKGQAETTIVLNKNITVKGQFIGHSYAQKVVIDLNGFKMSSADKALTVYRAGTTVLLKNGTVHGNTTGGTIQVTYGGKLTLGENVTITCGGSANALKVDANSTLIIADETVKVLGGKNDLVVAENAIVEISAGFFKHPVKAEWCAEFYAPTDKLENGYYSVYLTAQATVTDADGNVTHYATLGEAITEAAEGSVITLNHDVNVTYADAVAATDGFKSFFVVSGKTITIDLNGKTVYGDATESPVKMVNGQSAPEGLLLGMFTTVNNGHLTLKDSSNGQGTVELKAATGDLDANGMTTSYYAYGLIVNYDDDCSIIIEDGNYIADDVYDALVYTSCDKGAVVNGGYFKLTNVGLGSRGNGSPWIFNARGQQIRSVVVKGGTFNANVNAQYWVFEVDIDKSLALKDNGDGTWTIVPAVAYVNKQHWASSWYTRETGYATLEEAFAALEGVKIKTSGKKTYTSEEEIVTLLANITLTDETVIRIAKDQKVTLDLNGYTLSYEAKAAGNVAIVNNGELTIQDSSEAKTGAIALTFTGTEDNSKAVNTIANTGILTVNGGTISNTGKGNQIGYAIDNYNGATLTVNGGKVVASGSGYYDGIRLFCGSNQTTVTINGGEVSTIWAQNPSANKASAVKGTVILNGGEVGVTYFENYTTVKVKAGIEANVKTYGAGTPKAPETLEDGTTVYSFDVTE